MTTKSIFSTTIAALTISTGSVFAQDAMISAQNPLKISVGTYNPLGGSFRNAMGASLPMVSFNYDTGKTLSEKPILYGAFFDYAQNRKNGTNNSVSAFGVSARYMSQSPRIGDRYFVGAGVGSYSIKTGETNSKIGGKLFAGYEHNSGYYGEVSYHMINKIHGEDPSALGFSIGKRF